MKPVFIVIYTVIGLFEFIGFTKVRFKQHCCLNELEYRKWPLPVSLKSFLFIRSDEKIAVIITKMIRGNKEHRIEDNTS